MHFLKKIILTTVGFVFINACNKNPFEQVVTVNLPKPEVGLVPALSLNNYFSPRLKLTLTQDPLADFNVAARSIPNASVEILENGISKGFMKLDTNSQNNYNFYEMVTPFIPQASKEYDIKISHPNYKSVSAKDAMPSYVAVDVVNTGKFKFVKSPYNGQQVDTFREVKLIFTDPIASGDYYRLIITDSIAIDSIGNTYQSNNIYNGVISNDIIFSKYQDRDGGPINITSNGNKYLDLLNNFFTDEFINGKTAEVLIYIAKGIDFGQGTYFSGYRKPHFYLQHHSAASYKFNTTYTNYESNNGNPFSQPVILYSNVVGGFGILGCNTIAVDSLQF